MSSKSSIFLTVDNEHCYDDCHEPHYKDDIFIGNTIYLEMSKENIEITSNNKEGLVIKIIPGSELYEMIKNIDDSNNKY